MHTSFVLPAISRKSQIITHTALAHLRDDNRQMLHGISRHFSQPQLVSESLAGNSFYTSL